QRVVHARPRIVNTQAVRRQGIAQSEAAEAEVQLGMHDQVAGFGNILHNGVKSRAVKVQGRPGRSNYYVWSEGSRFTRSASNRMRTSDCFRSVCHAVQYAGSAKQCLELPGQEQLLQCLNPKDSSIRPSRACTSGVSGSEPTSLTSSGTCGLAAGHSLPAKPAASWFSPTRAATP